MIHRRLLQVALSTALALPAAAALGELLPFSATYKSRHGLVSATGQRVLESSGGGQWQLVNRAQLLMVEVTERTTFTVQDGSVLALGYQFTNPFRSERSQELSFDWAQKTVTEKKDNSQLTLPERAFDKLSYQVQLQLDVCANPDGFTARDYPVVDRGRIKTYRVEPVDTQVLSTGAGNLRTLKLRQFRPDRQNRETLVWVATEWNCLVARIEDHDDDEVVSLSLVKATVNGATVGGGR